MFKRLYGLGEQTIYETIRFYTMSAAEYLEEYFENDVVKAALSGSGIIGTGLGPYSPGTAYVFFFTIIWERLMALLVLGDLQEVEWDPFQNALAGAFQEHDGEIKTNAEVKQILVKNGKSVGVVLANGDELYAKNIVSNLDAQKNLSSCLIMKI